ncbi:NAD(P)-dependent dehydrogenase (short-subunit alcohol dehydrogenase family) [Caulobacter rhizosphaerae]|jgi:NAD(P)-dependent dehydrogenase (short-subunit alcohol dehydrogenase family)|uniref:NAD(P)-dependent dehydrogenase (Short-subunit alcohol dehydrogenase family) n=1 Tax=Caulobacter rhizosphaerae TaxID=2010972 RepID=A0ABU1N6Y1_9CAUL|nr:SDR family oxidoreductase [Caulobacter rhizosphaerae]MDR6534201.1 NAD(P)-dependent dehydrogenase (short-subunit alcohol dehydrogenase family) [Caulobacter rhizosphaerae]
MTASASTHGALDGALALVVELGLPLLSGVGEGLRDAGAEVVTSRDPRWAGSREDVDAALLAALGPDRAPALAVLSLLSEETTTLRPLSDLDLEAWRAGAADPIRIAMRVLAALGARMKPAGRGTILFLAPSLSLVGGSGMVALSTALEGQRGLMKSIARQWGATGVTVNWAAAAPRALSPHFDAADLAAKGDAVPIALGRRPDARTEIAALAAWLASPSGRGVTGATLMVDGGEWMVP